jgi:hypothetical protein
MPEGLQRHVPGLKTYRVSLSRKIIPGGNLQPQAGLTYQALAKPPLACDIVSQRAEGASVTVGSCRNRRQ